MSALGLKIIDESVQQANIWINEVDERAGWGNKQRAYRLLRSVLHAIRDHLSVDEAAQLAAQMPIMIRGIYYEGWDPSKTPVRDRTRAAFLQGIQRDFRSDPLGDEAAAVGAVLDTLDHRISEGEMNNVRRSFSKDIRGLFFD
ncbi:DUF2267 domain-containing protein [Ovoidimarina sediminis]|uniref:DUF2267 domain-containing protein n=1 Tax=Ovoidimarina sediminis TaxID=3079856 RepID=UPI002914EEE5|nr:DUF2267 domain-containing protein [Rhodophyticola sp. MJ-SS7]MDU8942273.1 DUF2267 domain-containing protein [Rhodophyticola sp. MJ-SS7]